jgi:hypothetical protein
MLNIKNAVRIAAAAAALAALHSTASASALINGGFELPAFSGGVNFVNDTTNPATNGWRTTATDHQIEYWSHGALGVASYEGNQHVELNAYQVSTLYQDVSGIAAGSTVGYQFAHRGRAGVDSMRLVITDLGADNIYGNSDDTVLFSQLFSDGNTAWGFYSDANALTALGNGMRFAYESVSAAGGPTVGNFLDAVAFGVGVAAPVPEPSSIALSLLGLAGVGAIRRKSAKARA